MSISNRILDSMPTWLLGTIFIASSIAIFASLVYVVRNRWKVENLKKNNEVAGFKYAVLGVLYAVVLAGALISVWDGYAEARQIAGQEADDTVELYRLAQGFPGATRDIIRNRLHLYAESVVQSDWPMMQKSKDSPATTLTLDEIFRQYAKIRPANSSQEQFLASSLSQLDDVSDSRRNRILKSQEGLPGVMWAVLIVGAIFTLAFTYLFGTENAGAQAVMTSLLTGTMSLALFVILCLNQPFGGDTRVPPTAMQRALEYMDGKDSMDIGQPSAADE